MEQISMTTGAALQKLNISIHTFLKYARTLGIRGQKRGRFTLYTTEEIEKIKNIIDDSIPKMIAAVEKATSKKVQLV